METEQHSKIKPIDEIYSFQYKNKIIAEKTAYKV